MKEKLLPVDECLARLRDHLDRLAALTANVPLERLEAAPAPDEWSPNEVLAHLRACSDVWGGNIAKILASDHPTFAGTNPRTWFKQTDYGNWRFDQAFQAFKAQREELLNTLNRLAPADWERSATVTAWNQPNQRTLRSYASQLAKHERVHVSQVEAALR